MDVLLCAACIASAGQDQQKAAWNSRWAVTIYRGNALCMDHYEEIRAREGRHVKEAKAQATS